MEFAKLSPSAGEFKLDKPGDRRRLEARFGKGTRGRRRVVSRNGKIRARSWVPLPFPSPEITGSLPHHTADSAE